MFFKDENVPVQAQILRSLLISNKLKKATTLLSIQKTIKYKQMKENVIQNINSDLKSIGKCIKKSDIDVCRAIQIAMVSSSTKENRLVKYMEKH